MTRSAREVISSAFGVYGDAEAARILTRLAEDEFALADLRTHVVAPREPTEAMIEAGVNAYELEHVDCIYKAMLAAIDGKDGK
jgi:hypothetical protein